MAIDRIPGVGPTNADIATAVAAPSSATIASAVAAAVPTLAQINTSVTNNGNAYNGPSAATIASTVAAAVPTTAGITTIVQANAGSPFGGTWTTISYVNFGATAGTAGLNVSGLTGYKYLRLFSTAYCGADTSWRIRLNGDTGNNYFGMSSQGTRGTTGVTHRGSQWNATSSLQFPEAFAANQPPAIDIVIPNSNSGARKILQMNTMAIYGSGTIQNWQGNGFGFWNSDAQISSLQMDAFGTNVTGGYILLLGAN